VALFPNAIGIGPSALPTMGAVTGVLLMMGPVELEAYFVRINLPEAGRRLVEVARRESPVRKVQSRLGNVLTRFPSGKMRRAVTTESRTVEFPAVIQYERDASVLEYYAQPVHLDLRVTDGGTKKPSRFQHIPDFLLLREDCVRIEEWREEGRLEKLASKYPGRFTKSERGWSCPDVEEHLHRIGIQYRLRTPSEHPEILVQNLLFLADYYAPDAEPVSTTALNAIQGCLREHGAISLANLIALGKLSPSQQEA
jgi:putative transposase